MPVVLRQKNNTCLPEFWTAWKGAYYFWSRTSASAYFKWRVHHPKCGSDFLKQYTGEACDKGKWI